jgi:hypothetical protein
MSSGNDLKFLYRRSLSQPLSELLTDPFSELTRKRRATLLIAATVTLLLSAGLITLSEVGVADVKFTLSTPQIARWLAFTVTFYALIVYLLSARADWIIAKVRRWSRLASIADAKAKMVSDAEGRSQADLERKEEMERLKLKQQEIKAEMRVRFDEISARRKEIEASLESLPDIESASPEELEQITSLNYQKTELSLSHFAAWQEEDELLDPYRKAHSELAFAFSLEPTILMRAEQRDIEPQLSTFSRLTRLRLWVEILFTDTYAVFALFWTVLN